MNRLIYYRKRKGISQEELGKKLGVPKSNISAWENGTRAIPIKHLDRLGQILGLTEPELLNAVSDSVFDHPTGAKPSNVRKPSDQGMFVPIISSAAAASCNPGLMPLLECVNQYSEETAFFKQAKEGDFAIEVSGTSMSPWYPEGTLLLVRPYQDLHNGQRVVAVLDEGEIVFKVYAEKDDKVCLFSISGDGQDYIFTRPQVRIRYICRVVASIRNEDDLDEEMKHQSIVHNWELKLKNL